MEENWRLELEESSNHILLRHLPGNDAKKSDEPGYCNKNVATPRATSFTYQPGVRTNLEVIVLYAQVKVKVLPVVTAHLARDPRGSKLDFYRVKRSLILMEGEKTYSRGELFYCRNEESNHVILKSHQTLAN